LPGALRRCRCALLRPAASENAADRMSEQVRSAVPEAMTLEDVEVREVAAHA
jgi:hypothetical protein